MSCHHNDPCNNPLLPTTNVGYSGPNLPCTGITTNEVLTISLQKIDEQICNLIASFNSLQEQVNKLTTTSTTTTTIPPTTTSTTSSTSSTTSTSSTSTTSTSSTSTTSTSSTSTTSTTSTSSTSTTSTTSSTTSTTTTIYDCTLAGNAVEIVTTTTTTTTGVPVLCDEYFNNTGGALTVDYTDCGGTVITNASVDPNQSICAQQGTVTGPGAGFLTNIGSCSL